MNVNAARRALAGLLPALFLCMTPAGGQEAARLSIWDTQSTVEENEVDLGARKNWEQVAPGTTGRALSGDVVIENERITVLFCRRGAGPAIFPRGAKDRARIVTVAPGGETASTLCAIEIRKNDKSEIVLEAASTTPGGKEIRASYSLGRGRSFLEAKPLRNADRVRIEAPTRFAVIPDFFGADMVFDPRAYPQPRLVIPPENFVLDLLEGGNTIVMGIWPAGNQEARLVLEGAQEGRRIGATEITFDSKSLYVGVLHAPGLWHEYRLKESYTDKDLPMGWKRPFPAKWRANFCSGRRSDSWDFQDRRNTTWMYLYQEIVWPCWFDGENGFTRLSKKFIGVKGPMEFVLVYPSERRGETPLAASTPVDLLRDTLGVGPCEYVLDREGLQGRSANAGRKSFGRGVCDTTTPIEYLFIMGSEARENALIGHLLDDILADNVAINARVLEFRRFGEDLGSACAAMRKETASASPLLDEAEKTAKAIEAYYQEKLPTIHNPAHAAGVARRLRELTSRNDPENLGECKTLTYELRDIAGTQHTMVGEYRVMVKKLRQEAAIQGSESPAASKIAESIRKLGGQVLRKKYGVEAD